jgi:hypothetical protein
MIVADPSGARHQWHLLKLKYRCQRQILPCRHSDEGPNLVENGFIISLDPGLRRGDEP